MRKLFGILAWIMAAMFCILCFLVAKNPPLAELTIAVGVVAAILCLVYLTFDDSFFNCPERTNSPVVYDMPNRDKNMHQKHI